MVQAITWRMSPAHIDESVRVLHDYMDEEGASIVVRVDEEWLPLVEVAGDDAELREWNEVVDGIGIEGECSTALTFLDGIEGGDVRVVFDDEVDGMVLWIGERPVLAVAGPAMSSLPKGLMHLEAAELTLEALDALAETETGRNLVSLDVGGNEHLSSLESPGFAARLAKLRALDLSELEGLCDVTPLSALTDLTDLSLEGCSGLKSLASLVAIEGLVELDLSNCESVQDLSPLGKLKSLSFLDLSGCSGLKDLSPLAELPALSELGLSGINTLPDLAPLVRIVSLTSLDLSECPHLESVATLRACGNLERLDLTGCAEARDFQALAECTNLRELALDDEELSAVVLAGAAVKRVDAAMVEENVDAWLGLLEQSKAPARLILALLPAVGLGAPSDWTRDAVATLVAHARGSVLPERGIWADLFGALVALGEPAGRTGVQRALEGLAPGTDTLMILRAALDVVGKSSDATWAYVMIDAALDPLLTTPRGSDIAPDAVRYYARKGHIAALEPWLELLGRVPAPLKPPPVQQPPQPIPSIEDDPAALGGLVARLVQKQPDSPPVAQLVAALVGLARERPDSHVVEPFVDHFARLIVDKSESVAVARLGASFSRLVAEHPGSAATGAIMSAVVNHWHAKPDDPNLVRMGEELATLMSEQPDHPAVAKFVQMVESARDAGVVGLARSVLEHQAVVNRSNSAQRESFVAGFDVRAARRALIRGVIDTLCAEDVLGNKPRIEVLEAVEADLADG